MDLAFLGLGQMGIGMAGALIDAGHTLTVWNRSPDKAAALTERGARLARTPREAADGAQGKLAIVAAGAPEAMEAAVPILEALGRVTYPMGDKPAAANLVKLAGNFMIMATVETYGEAMSLGEKGGVSREKMLEVFSGTIFDGAIHKVYGPPIAERRHRPAGFAAPLGLKEIRLAGEAADAVGAKMPLLDLVRAHLTETVKTEGTDVDVTALAETIAKL